MPTKKNKTAVAKRSKKASARRAQTPTQSKKTASTRKVTNRNLTKRKPTGSCFVLIPFKEPFDGYYDSIISPAVTSANLEPLRGDSLFRPSPIMSDIWKMIREAKVLVADLTEKNANVFYELGLAHAIGKPVILVAETIDNVPFDLQSLRVLKYDKNHPTWGNRLKAALASAIRETLSDTRDAVPAMFRKVVKSQAPTETKTESRLTELERHISSLTRPGRDKISEPTKLYEELAHAQTTEQRIEVVNRALLGGMGHTALRRTVDLALPSAETSKKLWQTYASRPFHI